MSVIRNSGVSAVEGVEYIEVYGNTIRTFRIVHLAIAGVRRYGVSVKRVPLLPCTHTVHYIHSYFYAEQ